MDLQERLTDAGYAAGWAALRTLPETPARGLFDLGARWATRRRGAGVRQLRRNLVRVVPDATAAELDELVQRGMRSYARYWCEAFRLPAMDPRQVRGRVADTIEGLEYLDSALAAGRGAVVALPHAGNWDAAGVYLVAHSGPFTTVVERLEPESLYRRFVSYREALGFEVLPLRGDRTTNRTLIERLRNNRVVCLIADRDLTGAGIDVNFFGEVARMPTGPATLAAATGAPLLPADSWFTNTGWGFRVHEPVPVSRGRSGAQAATQAMADAFAEGISRHPSDWHMLQPLWTADVEQPETSEEDAGAPHVGPSAKGRP